MTSVGNPICSFVCFSLDVSNGPRLKLLDATFDILYEMSYLPWHGP